MKQLAQNGFLESSNIISPGMRKRTTPKSLEEPVSKSPKSMNIKSPEKPWSKMFDGSSVNRKVRIIKKDTPLEPVESTEKTERKYIKPVEQILGKPIASSTMNMGKNYRPKLNIKNNRRRSKSLERITEKREDFIPDLRKISEEESVFSPRRKVPAIPKFNTPTPKELKENIISPISPQFDAMLNEYRKKLNVNSENTPRRRSRSFDLKNRAWASPNNLVMVEKPILPKKKTYEVRKEETRLCSLTKTKPSKVFSPTRHLSPAAASCLIVNKENYNCHANKIRSNSVTSVGSTASGRVSFQTAMTENKIKPSKQLATCLPTTQKFKIDNSKPAYSPKVQKPKTPQPDLAEILRLQQQKRFLKNRETYGPKVYHSKT